MKKTAIFILTLSSLATFAQKVSDYKYVSLPTKFTTFKEDFGLGEILTKTLRSKNYIVIPSDKFQWPVEAQRDLCSVLIADIINDSGLLKNKVLLQFKDCNDKSIAEIKGSSSIKDFKEGYQDALEKTFVSLSPANPAIHSKVQETASASNQPFTTDTSQNFDNNAVRFSNGKIDLQKIQIDGTQFILANPNSSSPFATFKTTTKNDVFRVKLQNGESTLGYFENGNIVIEIPQANGEYTKEVFSKK